MKTDSALFQVGNRIYVYFEMNAKIITFLNQDKNQIVHRLKTHWPFIYGG
jgi:hypothetical protein